MPLPERKNFRFGEWPADIRVERVSWLDVFGSRTDDAVVQVAGDLLHFVGAFANALH
jgi:predicted Zn-dependent protease with MMP-like domain